MVDLALFVLGLALLYAGGEALVRSASALARLLGMGPLLIGLTVVAFGTSAPELAATAAAALEGRAELALGNIIGSNTANLGLILALAAIIAPLNATTSFLKREVLVMVLTAIAAPLLLLDGEVARLEGFLLLAAFAVFLAFLVLQELQQAKGGDGATGEAETGGDDRGADGTREGAPARGGRAVLYLLGTAVGVALLVAGARSLVTGATGIARELGVPEAVIGLTLVAIGTSLPELASTLVAMLRGEREIVLGNLVGSNIFNLLLVLGVTSALTPLANPGGMIVDGAVMLGFTALVTPLLATGLELRRWEGVLLLALYLAYVASRYL